MPTYTYIPKDHQNSFKMLAPSIILLLASAGLIEARSLHEASAFSVHNPRHSHGLLHQRATADDTSLTLSSKAVQVGSQNDGTLETGASEGQAKSATSSNNFINNCVGKTLTNGLQIIGGSCNGIRKSSPLTFKKCLTSFSDG